MTLWKQTVYIHDRHFTFPTSSPYIILITDTASQHNFPYTVSGQELKAQWTLVSSQRRKHSENNSRMLEIPELWPSHTKPCIGSCVASQCADVSSKGWPSWKLLEFLSSQNRLWTERSPAAKCLQKVWFTEREQNASNDSFHLCSCACRGPAC